MRVRIRVRVRLGVGLRHGGARPLLIFPGGEHKGARLATWAAAHSLWAVGTEVWAIDQAATGSVQTYEIFSKCAAYKAE